MSYAPELCPECGRYFTVTRGGMLRSHRAGVKENPQNTKAPICPGTGKHS